MKRLTEWVAAALALTLVTSVGLPARAAEPAVPASPAAAVPGRTINMGVGKSIIVDLPQDAAEIFVGNPKVANAVVRTARKLYIVAMDNGQTSIFAMDRAGRQIAAFQISVGRDVGELQQILRTALPRDSIVARTVGDTIILTGTVESAGDAQQAVDIANGFIGTAVVGGSKVDGQVVNSLVIKGKDQVMLKVTLVEIQRTVIKELGISTTGTWSTGSFGPTPTSLTNATQIFTNTWNTHHSSFEATLQALERYGLSHVLAEPTVTAISGENAKFTAGGEIPVPGSYTPASGTSPATVGIEFKQYGVTLNFAPVVLSEGRILLRVATEVTEIDQDHQYTYSANISIPAFRTRKNETTVELPSGGSIVSAGLLQTRNRNVLDGVPALMNLPVLGALFRSRDYQREETELMIVVTPYIARAVDPKDVTRPDDGLADASDPQGWFLGRVNRLYSTTTNPQALQNFKGRVGFITD